MEIDWIDVPLQTERGPNNVEVRRGFVQNPNLSISDALHVRKHPMVLPEKLVCHPSWPAVDAGAVRAYWQHLAQCKSPLANLSPSQNHVPVWLWGDEAQFRKGSGDNVLLLCMGAVLDTRKFSVECCYPLTLCRSDAFLCFSKFWNTAVLDICFNFN